MSNKEFYKKYIKYKKKYLKHTLENEYTGKRIGDNLFNDLLTVDKNPHLLGGSNGNEEMKHSDIKNIVMYDLAEGRDSSVWENTCLHPEYLKCKQNLDTLPVQTYLDGKIIEFPLFSDDFCKMLIDELEHFGKWSGGGHDGHADPRIQGGYENVPTQDIHMHQIGWEDQWKKIELTYLKPIVQKYFNHELTSFNINFAVKYDMHTQKELKPHHDTSNYSISIPLNTPGVDFEGGGTHFINENYTHTGRRGYGYIFPGQGMYHRGEAIVSGTRYILISFMY